MANRVEEYLAKKADLDKTPLKGSLEVTPLCNLNCRMCYIHHTKEEADSEGGVKKVDFWLSLIPEMKKAGTLFINLIGGEPLIYPGIDVLYQELSKNGFVVTFTTNGFMLSEQIPSWMLQHKPRFVIVSLYGASNQTYENLCGDKKGFDKVISALENLKQAGIQIKINLCISPYNVQDLDELYRIAKQYAAQIDCSSYMYPPVRKEHAGEETPARFTPEQAAKIDFAIQKNKLSEEQYVNYCNYFSDAVFEQNTPRHTKRFSCKAGTSTFWVNWHGKMTLCGMIEEPSADLAEVPFKEAWERMKHAVMQTETCEDCASCEKRAVCIVCPAIMKAETGSISGKPSYCCDLLDAKIRFAREKDESC